TRKVKLKSTVKIKQWHKNEVEIFEENSYVQECEKNRTIKYFIGPTYRTSSHEELGGCWIFRSRKHFDPWKIGQCKTQGVVKRSKRDDKDIRVKHTEKIKKNVEEWIKVSRILNPEGEFIMLTTVRDRHVGSRRTGYAELEAGSDTKMSLELNKTAPWIWKRTMALPRVKCNFKINYWELDDMKRKTEVYLIKMELDKTLKTENEIKNYYENKVKQMDKCVRKEISKRSHGQKYKYTKTDYNELR
ncbi:MAG: hypothetical protein ACRCXE_02135, partial [Metamycoplasmataceae bacterium]